MNIDLNNLDLSDLGSWPMPMKAIAVVAVIIGVLSLHYVFFIKDEIKVLNIAEQEEQGLKQQLKTLHARAVNLPAYREQMKVMERRFGVMLRKLPSATEMPELLEDISRTGHTSGLSIVAIQPNQEIEKEFYVELPIEIKVSGNYHQIGSFISQVANLPRIVTLHNFEMNLEEQTPLNMKISAKIYHYSESESGSLEHAEGEETLS